ncbi:NifU-like N terminal domain-containing protein [Phyllosticta citrichinensis]
MFRRVLATAPASAGKLVASAARPQIASPLLQRTGGPAMGGAFAQLTTSALLDHYNRPRNVGSMSKNDGDVGTGLVGAPACGDVMKLQIRVDPDSNTISDVKFKTFGCGSAIASSSYLTELVRGMTLEQAARIKNTEIAKELCLPPVKLHCSMLAEDAIKSAISNYYTKNPKARATDLGGTGAPLPKVEIETVTESPKAAAASANA